MNKLRKIIVLILCLFLCGCETNEGASVVDSEKAMENFLTKLEEGNYVMSDPHLIVSVASRDQVSFDYTDETYRDFGAVSLNNEAFQIVYDDPDDVTFLGEGQAIDAAKKRLPNRWLEDSEGNIWNLFYNMQEDPLRFVSHEDVLKQSVLSFAGYKETALRLMHDVYLVLDKEDPSSAHITAEVDDDMVARINYEDIDIAINFGNAESNASTDAWLNNPVYPEKRDGWNETDEFVFNSVFLPGYGLEAIPFPAFASYALKVDEENFLMNDEVCIRDSHASEKDLEDYVKTLLDNGFTEVKETGEDGSEKTCYRKMLREAFKCYSSIALSYDKGLDLVARKYYDFPLYDSLADINQVIEKAGYPVLEDSENFVSLLGTDRANEMTESWLYFFNYDLGLYADIEFKDEEQMKAYLKNYEETLQKAGFKAVKEEEEDEDAIRYDSENGFYSFRHNEMENGKVSLLFKSEKYINAKEAEKLIADAGFPKISLHEPTGCRDLKLFQKTQYGRDRKAYITLSQEFASAQEAEKFLGDLEALLNEAGYDRENPANVGSNKQIAIVNEEKGAYVGIDYFPDQASVYFEFVAD